MKKIEAQSYLACSESALRIMIKNGTLKQDGKDIQDQSVYELTKNAKEIYTVSGAAELLDVSNQTILQMVKQGKLDYFKVGSGKGNSGLRIIDINKNRATDSKKPLSKKTEGTEKKDNNSARVIVQKIHIDEVDILVSIQGDQEQALTKLYRSFLKAWVEGNELENKLLKLKELLGND